MATEMIKGAEYMFGSERYTFVDVSMRDAEWGSFRHTCGEAYELRLCDAVPVAKPTPFPEPERWQSYGRVVGTPKQRWVENVFEAVAIAGDHNTGIDRLMGEIRRLESLVAKINHLTVTRKTYNLYIP